MSGQQRIFSVLGLCVLFIMISFSVASAADVYAYEPWNWYISGSSNLDFGLAKNTAEPEEGDTLDTRHTLFGAGFRYGVFVIQGLEIGLGAGFDFDKADEDSSVSDGQGGTKIRVNTTKTNDFMAGPQIAYFLNLGGIDPFVAVLGGYDWRSEEYTPEKGSALSDTYGGYAYDVSVGVNFLINTKIGLSPAFYYTGYQLSGTDESLETDATTGAESVVETDTDRSGYRYGFRVALNLFL